MRLILSALTLLFVLQTNVLSAKTNFKLKEATLAMMIRSIAEAQDSTEKHALNKEFMLAFEETLQLEGAVKYPFKNIPYLYQITSPDKRLRIITWSVPIGDDPHFFGFALFREEGNKEVKLIRLNEIETPPALTLQKTLTPEQWAGALYTQVLQRKDKKLKKTYYTLLGLRLKNKNFGSKLIDVATISGDTLSFGAPIFSQRNRKQMRVVFEHNPQAIMKLEYNKKLKKIIFTSLAPFPGMPRNEFEHYLPADSYDGFTWDGACWIFEENIPMPSNLEQKKYDPPVATNLLPE